ncbi:MAG: OmpH family outer membrane protein [Catalinimonas sp.]
MNYRLTLILLACLGMTQVAAAQDAKKFGYTNVNYILSVMPESRQIESELSSFSKQLENQLQAKARDFEDQVRQYEQGRSTMTDETRQQREQTLQRQQQEIQEFQQSAEGQLQERQVKLLQPVTEKISKAIEDVALENGYTYIFNSDAGLGTTQILLYAPEQDNVTDIVLKKLGVEPPANATGDRSR